MIGIGGGKSKSKSKQKAMNKWQSKLGKGIAKNFGDKFKDSGAMFDYMNKPTGPYGQMWGGEAAPAGSAMESWQQGNAAAMRGGPDTAGRSQAFQDQQIGLFNNKLGYDPQQEAAWNAINSRVSGGGGSGGEGGGPPLDAAGYGQYYNAIMGQMRPQSQLALQDAQAQQAEQMGASGHSFSTDLMGSNQRMNNQFEADLMRNAVDPSVSLYNNERNNWWNGQNNAVNALSSALTGTYGEQYGGRNALMGSLTAANQAEMDAAQRGYETQVGALGQYGQQAQDAWQYQMANQNRNLWNLMGLNTGKSEDSSSSWNAEVGYGGV